MKSKATKKKIGKAALEALRNSGNAVWAGTLPATTPWKTVRIRRNTYDATLKNKRPGESWDEYWRRREGMPPNDEVRFPMGHRVYKVGLDRYRKSEESAE